MSKKEQKQLWWAWICSRGKVAYLLSCVVEGFTSGALSYLAIRQFGSASTTHNNPLFFSPQGALIWFLTFTLVAVVRGVITWSHYEAKDLAATQPNLL